MKTGFYNLGNGVTMFVDCECAEERWVQTMCHGEDGALMRAEEEQRLHDDIMNALGATDLVDDDLITEVPGCYGVREWGYDMNEVPS